jgi:hypothetical protein
MNEIDAVSSLRDPEKRELGKDRIKRSVPSG